MPPESNADKFARLEAQVAELQEAVTALADAPVADPNLVRELQRRIDELERPSYVDMADPEAPQDTKPRSVPPQELCDECGGLPTRHFDDCSQYVEKPERLRI